jgi:uncharacterized Zn finger protein
MENNKTAVDWLFHQLWDEPKDKFTWYAILEKAKAMHRQEIIDAFLDGKVNHSKDWAFEYYNEKYGKDNADNSAL